VTIDKQSGHATVLCALCQLKDEFPAHPAAQMIDVYSYFTDRFYGVKDPRPIIPREREYISAPAEPEPGEALETPKEESTAIELAPETSLTEVPSESHSETPVSEPAEVAPSNPVTPAGVLTAPAPEAAEQETSQSPEAQDKTEAEDESEPFADIIGENKDKKRYSPNPLPSQTSEQS